MKNVVLICILILYSNPFFGQGIAHFGNHTISREEFLTAFRKNNAQIQATDKVYRDYLNLYIRYRLKVQAAYDLKLDTLSGQITDLQNFKNQIADQYTNDEGSLNQMAEEAFTRSKKDLRVSYIYVTIPKNASPADTIKAFNRIQQAYEAVKNNRDFGEIALQYSDDPFVKNNHGDLGFITVFDLPYVIENAAYRTPKGKYSPVFRTNGGYIILKTTDKRPAEGRIHIAQILLIFPYLASITDKGETRRRADSILRALHAGSDFGEMARKLSGDNLTYQLGGVLPEFGIGKYEAGFEQTAFSLKKDGDLSAPYESEFGYHIIKRISRKPVPVKADQKYIDELKERVKSDPRVILSRNQMLQKILKQTQYKEYITPNNRLWDYTDSVLKNKKPSFSMVMNDQLILFKISTKEYTVGDWITYRKSLLSSPVLTNGKTQVEIFNMYRENSAFEYYKNHLENYNKQYAGQVSEFRDGNLLFEIMQREVWDKAAADSNGLKLFFDANSRNYWWQPGAEAIIINAPNQTSALGLQEEFRKKISSWRKTLEGFGPDIQVDSGRFEWKQIPGNRQVGTGGFTELLINADKSVQFAYIVRTYSSPSPRNFSEARGIVMNDYQKELENKWIGELKKKYPVSKNESVIKNLPK